MQTFVDVTDDSYGLLIASRGLPEYEVLPDTVRTIALTLLRSVGWLSRDDLTTRRGHAGPELATPQAQCPGRHSFHYSIIPHQNTWRNPSTQSLLHAFITPLKAIQIQETTQGKFPLHQSFLTFNAKHLAFSCLKKATTSESTILRFFELTGKETDATITTSAPCNHVTSVNLAERPSDQESISQINQHKFTTLVKPYQIQTILLSHAD
jgi:alpha-mannosidase